MNGLPVEDDVFVLCLRYVAAHSVTLHQRRLLEAALEGLRIRFRQAGPNAHLGCVQIPLLIYACLRGDPLSALPLATANTLLHAGIDILDDVMDGDPRPWWYEYDKSEVLLAAAMLICALPQLALSELDAPATTIVNMQGTLAMSGMVMAAGQQQDLVMTNNGDVSVEDVIASIEAKSGEAMAVAATLAALLAGASSQLTDACGRVGRALGTAVQLRSDCIDLFVAPDSGDLQHGTRTLPVTLYLEHVQGSRRTAFLALLGRARSDIKARVLVRTRLLRWGALQRAAQTVDQFCERAYAALGDIGADGPAPDTLRTMIRDCSLFPESRTKGGQT